MLTIYVLKPGFRTLLRPFASRLARAGITANQVTLLTCASSVLVGLFLASSPRSPHSLLIFPIFAFVRMALNALDGILAMEFGQKSALGTYLNELTDVISDAFLYLPFAWLPGIDPLWIGAVIVLAIISEMTGTLGVLTGASRRYDGPMGKSDRAFVFGGLALWFGLGWNIARWAAYLFPRLIAALLLVTIINRMRGGLAETASQSL